MVGRSVGRSVGQSINQPTNQPTNQSKDGLFSVYKINTMGEGNF